MGTLFYLLRRHTGASHTRIGIAAGMPQSQVSVIMNEGRLERTFGTTLDNVTHAHVVELVTNAVTEQYDLEFKSAMYGRSDSEKRDLCGDVAAMAKTAGGSLSSASLKTCRRVPARRAWRTDQ
jgi:hypothetical protein